MDYFPLFARLQGEPCLIVGGGEVAARKARLLRAAGARVTVAAPALNDELDRLAAAGGIDWIAAGFRDDLVADALLVVAATDDEAINRQVETAARSARRLVNVVDDGSRSSFITPAIVDRSPLVVAVSTGGAMPVLARWLRQRLEALLPAGLGRLARAARALRAEVRHKLGDLGRRRRFWESVLDGPDRDRILAAADPEAELTRRLEGFRREQPRGRVYLVGAGPGDPDLLTLRALQVMQQADVVLYDQLVTPAILDRVRRDARRIDVGKKAGDHRVSQQRINHLLAELAGQGLRVVRLKGGDPFVFGRGGEELQALAAGGIDFEVVPGITAAAGCAAYAGIPLTHRDLASQVVFATAHCRDAMDCLDWEGLARPGQTRVFYMPVAHLEVLRDKLVAHGLDGCTPAALVERGTRPDQRVIRAELNDIAEVARDTNVSSPALLFLGGTAALHDELAWFGSDASWPEEPAERPLAVVA